MRLPRLSEEMNDNLIGDLHTSTATMESFTVAGIHPKLRNYKFNKPEECYDFMLKHHAPKESTVIRFVVN